MSGCLHADFFYWASLRRLCQAALRPIALRVLCTLRLRLLEHFLASNYLPSNNSADFFYWASLRRLCQAALRPIAHFLLDICVCYGSAMEVKCFSFLLTHDRKTGMLRAFHIDHILEIEGK